MDELKKKKEVREQKKKTKFKIRKLLRKVHYTYGPVTISLPCLAGNSSSIPFQGA